MIDHEYDMPMPASYKEVLLEIVNRAVNQDLFAVSYVNPIAAESPWKYIFYLGTTDKFERGFSEDILPGFEILGFIKLKEKDNGIKTFYLTPKAFKWATYQRKSTLGKWWAKMPTTAKDLMIGIAFLLSVGLTIIQILQALRLISVP